MKIAAVVGARPNFVKIAPIIAAMRRYPDVISSLLIHTGQHYDHVMSDTFFSDLEIPEPDVNLKVGSDAGVTQTAEIMLRLAPIVTVERPDLMIVVGDVNSTLAGALVAAKLQIPLAHVEAGLRSFDRTMPEEINRCLTDAIADYCFTTEPSANDNLVREGIGRHRIHYVGNVMIDTLFRFRQKAAASTILDRLKLETGKFTVLTLHRPSNVDDPRALNATLSALAGVTADVPMIFPSHPRTRARLDRHTLTAHWPGLRLIEPLAYLDFVQLMANAVCVFTDSGGIQEETTALGVPCLTLRSTTERPITVTHGTNTIVGTDRRKIANAWGDIRGGRSREARLPELWDGKAAERIVRVLIEHGSH